MNIPTRYVNGYLGDIGVPVTTAMGFAAWMEVFLDGDLHTFDPRNNKPRIGRIVVAYGRDAADVPLIHSFGPHVLQNFLVVTDEVPGCSPEQPEAHDCGKARTDKFCEQEAGHGGGVNASGCRAEHTGQ